MVDSISWAYDTNVRDKYNLLVTTIKISSKTYRMVHNAIRNNRDCTVYRYTIFGGKGKYINVEHSIGKRDTIPTSIQFGPICLVYGDGDLISVESKIKVSFDGLIRQKCVHEDIDNVLITLMRLVHYYNDPRFWVIRQPTNNLAEA